MIYGRVHRFLLRTIASRGVMSLAEMDEALNSFTDEKKPLQDIVKEINCQLRPLQQTIKLTNDEVTNEEVIVFLSLGHDEATKSQNIFSATELEYFILLIEQIMLSRARQINGVDALNLVSGMKSSLTKMDAQEILTTWCQIRYLDKEENNYALGVRAIHEFECYFRQNMPDIINECYLCRLIVFRGYNCPSCALAVHRRCLHRYLAKVSKWPCCKFDFSVEQLALLQICDQPCSSQSRPDSGLDSQDMDTSDEVDETALLEHTSAEAEQIPAQLEETTEQMEETSAQTKQTSAQFEQISAEVEQTWTQEITESEYQDIEMAPVAQDVMPESQSRIWKRKWEEY